MDASSWQAFYQSDLQSVYALMIAPVAFLAFRLAAATNPSKAEAPSAARFVAGLTLFFAFETLLDPVATGPLLRGADVADSVVASVLPFAFVYLGDLRVLLLVRGVARPDQDFAKTLIWASAMTFIVPIFAGAGFALARSVSPEIPDQTLWILYEFGFLVLCVALGRIWIPRRFQAEPDKADFMRAVFGYSAAYYSLWLAADLLIVVGRLDLGWAIRIVPNQLYYAFWVPFVHWRFFSGSGAKALR